ncbi:MAG: transglutaminase, partial [Comamonas sp.]
MLQRFGQPGSRRLQSWLELLERLRGKPLDQQLQGVNDFWNTEVMAGRDEQLWGSSDHWATPLE